MGVTCYPTCYPARVSVSILKNPWSLQSRLDFHYSFGGLSTCTAVQGSFPLASVAENRVYLHSGGHHKEVAIDGSSVAVITVEPAVKYYVHCQACRYLSLQMSKCTSMDLNHAAAILNPKGFKTFVSASETLHIKLVVKHLNARLGGPWGIKS